MVLTKKAHVCTPINQKNGKRTIHDILNSIVTYFFYLCVSILFTAVLETWHFNLHHVVVYIYIYIYMVTSYPIHSMIKQRSILWQHGESTVRTISHDLYHAASTYDLCAHSSGRTLFVDSLRPDACWHTNIQVYRRASVGHTWSGRNAHTARPSCHGCGHRHGCRYRVSSHRASRSRAHTVWCLP